MADYDAIVVGAGFSGIRSLWELGQLGLSVKCFEAGSDIGGAWYWNRYPGARTDSEAWVYTMNFTSGMGEEFNYHERYPSQQEVQSYLKRIAERFNLLPQIEFNTRICSAHYNDSDCTWKITTSNGVSTTCRYFLAATGPLSIAKEPPFDGLKSYTGEWYQSSSWPKEPIDFSGKRIAVVGTGATGVQIIPKLAPVAKQLTVFQRTPNYVLPGRNYVIDEYQKANIKTSFDATWKKATSHPFGLAMTATGDSVQGTTDEKIRQVLDSGWESGGFHFHFETFDDLFTNQESNDVASEYLRRKIHAIVQDPEKAEILSPRYPFLSKRPPCGHFYYETYKRPNVSLVDLSGDTMDLYEKGIRTGSGVEYEFDVIIFALGFDAGTGALCEMDIKGSQGRNLSEFWAEKVETFAGVVIPGFPNMFTVCGPHIPFGNMPVVLEIAVKWIGKTVRHMEENGLVKIIASENSAQAWSSHLNKEFESTLFKDAAKKSRAWFVGANIPDKAVNPLFYFGGVPKWEAWLDAEAESAWPNMEFTPRE
ncbi:cyclohexanone monooxygenase [Pestalotiopsis sp. NC0098]|nr:cyclohexanone monooxygenase [Pestalotiopsis sp. NC0098]